MARGIVNRTIHTGAVAASPWHPHIGYKGGWLLYRADAREKELLDETPRLTLCLLPTG